MNSKISDIVPEKYKVIVVKLAEEHVDWLLDLIRPILVEEFKHGYRHGWEDKENE